MYLYLDGLNFLNINRYYKILNKLGYTCNKAQMSIDKMGHNFCGRMPKTLKNDTEFVKMLKTQNDHIN